MKTLILEDNALRARMWESQFGGVSDTVHVARSPAQARLMLLGLCYDRFCYTRGAQGGAGFALLSVARAMNPDCEIVDLATLRRRTATGPLGDGPAERIAAQ